MRKRIFLGVVALVAVVGLMLPELATAHVTRSSPRINIAKNPGGATEPGERVVVSGDINGKRLCRNGRVVTLFEVQPGADRRVDTDRSDREGEFRFVLQPNDDMTVYAKIRRLVNRSYSHRHVCQRARSENQDINVSG